MVTLSTLVDCIMESFVYFFAFTLMLSPMLSLILKLSIGLLSLLYLILSFICKRSLDFSICMELRPVLLLCLVGTGGLGWYMTGLSLVRRSRHAPFECNLIEDLSFGMKFYEDVDIILLTFLRAKSLLWHDFRLILNSYENRSGSSLIVTSLMCLVVDFRNPLPDSCSLTRMLCCSRL